MRIIWKQKLKSEYDKLNTFLKTILDYLISFNEANDKSRIFTELDKLRSYFVHSHIHIEIDSDGVLGTTF